MQGTHHRPIEDYALIGDMQTAALVSRDGSIDWLCLPRFDSDAVFAALLGDKSNGQWQLNPTAEEGPPARRPQVERSYLPDTLVLTTQWRAASGSVRVIDFMPPQPASPVLIRMVEGLTGAVEMECVIRLRFGYGRVVPWVRRINGVLRGVVGPDAVWLATPVRLTGRDLMHRGSFVVRAGERVPFVLTWLPSHVDDPPPELDAVELLGQTVDFWTDWAAHCTYQGQHRDAVVRSLITIKALTYRP